MGSSVAGSRFLTLLGAGALCLVTQTGQATLAEGFESGLGPGESLIGDVGIQANYFGIAATQGNNQLLLTTINAAPNSPDANAGFTPQSGNNAVAVSSLASFFGISQSAIKNGTSTGQEGSGFTINLGSLSAGSAISLDYDFLTQEPSDGSGNRDFAFYTLTNQNGVTVIKDVFGATDSTPSSPSGNPFGNQSDYLNLTINVPTSGNYTLGIGVVDTGSVSTDDAPSALLVDNIQINAVPEPTTIAFSIAGAGLLVALRTRFKKSS